MLADTKGLDWLSGGGEMGALIRSMDWSSTPLGPFEAWPQSLRTTVSLCLSSTFPILIAWGPERIQIYNDSYRPIAGELHPTSMGQAFNECWASALPAVGHVLDRAQAGEGSYIENLRMFLDRVGYLEEAFMTFSFSPIRDESGRVGGLFHPITEVTEKMLGARRTQFLRELATQLGNVQTFEEIWRITAASYDACALDIPFLELFRLQDDAPPVRLGSIGLPGAPIAWPIGGREVIEVDDVAARLDGRAVGPYPELPRTALVMPILSPGMTKPFGSVVAGVSARRALDSSYRAFFEQLANTLTTAVTNVLAYEQEQKRAEELAALDRAKTAFFSNVSHEFRTPLTLILGPTEDALASPEQALRGEELATVHRNELRLLKLVNTLLDFSRIEAGRIQAAYEPVDLARYTADLASSFRSLVERAGITFVVRTEGAPAMVWVDSEMWEKIVLNLLSNAFKFTFEGEIAVELTTTGNHVELSVRDTGTGVSAAELPRLFERFHRVEGARGRSYEGSGIGLALVQELVRLHGGTIRVASELGRGTRFVVSLPLGEAHLPKERATGTKLASTSRADTFVQEAAAWLTSGDSARSELSERVEHVPPARGSGRLELVRHRVIVADDNRDMRDYLGRLLDGHFEVESVADGEAALEAARARVPALIVSDVMMPRLDGFGLLRALKAEPNLANVPVILLSARAGEEAKVEGIEAGASDYLVKPFSARELVARIEGCIRVAEAHRRLGEAHDRLARQAEFEQQLVGIVSHDLRNPLGAISMAATLLAQRPSDEKAARIVARIASSTDRAVRLVRDLLDFTQARLGGQLPILRSDIDLHAVVRQAVEEVGASYPTRGIDVSTSGHGEGYWDPDRMTQLVANLTQNALKYGATGTPVSVRVDGTAPDSVSIEVHNLGTPIEPELLTSIFEPMQRATSISENVGRSVGLGLFIVRQVVSAHGGTIAVSSTEAAGTTFHVELPRRA